MKLYIIIFNIVFGALIAHVTLGAMETKNSLYVHSAIRRLDKHLTALKEFNTKTKGCKSFYKNNYPVRFTLIDEFLEFSHNLLRLCVQKMADEDSLEPLFAAWRVFVTEYRDDVDNEIFVEEIGQLLFSIYKNIFTICIKNKKNLSSNSINWQKIQQIIDLYNQVSAIPLKRLLDTLDVCLEQFTEIMYAYEFVNNEMGWYAWVKKYWWVTPIIVASLIGNFFIDLFGDGSDDIFRKSA